ncbi:MAG: hypothetical protein WAU01_09190 [Saprospiraceae bacterium]
MSTKKPNKELEKLDLPPDIDLPKDIEIIINDTSIPKEKREKIKKYIEVI